MLMKKLFLLFAAIIAAVAVSAKEITVDLSKAQGYTHSETGSGAVELADGVLTVNWEVGTGWEVAGTEIPLDNLEGIIPLDNLEGVEKLDFDYVGDGGGTTMYVYLRDSEGNRWWNEDGYGLSVEDWTSVEFIPLSPLWDAPGYEVGEKPFVSIGFIANPASPTSGVFKLREVIITVADGEEPPVVEEGNAVYEWAPEDGVGITTLGESGVEISKVKIHANQDEVPAIKFGNSYKYAEGKYIAIKPAEGGFKAGDELQVAFCFSNSDDSKEARVAVYAADTETQLFLSELAVNGRTFEGNPPVEKYVLEADQDVLYIGRQGNTGLFVISLKVVRGEGGGEEPPVVGPAKPEAAPAAPAEDEANVMAVFCNYYANNNANFGISGWAGAYEILEIDQAKIAYWEGYTWECIIDPAHTDDPPDFSAFKNLHVDIWAPAAAKIKLQAEAVANYKDGVVIELQEGWNSVNIALEAWPGGYDFKNLKCFAVDGYKTPADESFEGNPLAIANLYFFGTDTPVTPPADEKEVIYSWEDEIGETVLGASGVELGTVKIHENTDEVPAIKFSSSYVFDDGKYIAIKPAEGGFKAGDELQIAVCFNNSSDDKNAQADIFAADGATELFLSEPGINGRTSAADPAVQKYVLESDQETLYIGRKGNTAMCVISLRVLRGEGGEVPPVVGPVKPEEAPAVPTHEAEDVLAINCATYEANLNWYPQWWGGSNVQWENLEFDKTIVYYTPQIAFDGITNAENSPVDVSGYEKFHFDVWVPQESHIMITFEGASGYKQGVDFKLNEGWNTIDADPAWWSDRQAYDWKDVKFVIFEGYKLADSENIDECTPASDKPFAFANFYWWKSPAPKNLPEAPAAPTMAEDHVQALFSASYLNNTFNFAPTSWGSQWIKVDYENGQSIWFSESFGWDGFTNGEADHYELSEEMDMMHADVYVTVDSKLKFTFEALSGWKNGLAVEGLKANQWNSVTLDLLNAPFDSYDFKDLRYLILEGFVKEADGTSAEGTPLGIANVYFYSSINEGVENVGAEQKAVKRIINGQLMIEKNGVLYNVLGTKF